jgi:hypothetical protein
MSNTENSWNALPHGPLLALQDNLWHVEGTLPKMSMKRRMCVAKMSDGRLVIHSAVALSDEGMAALDALGPVGFILVPNAFHRMDAQAYKERYPDARLLCPAGARKKVEDVVAVDGTYEEFPDDESVKLRHLDGLNEAEGVMSVSDEHGTSLVFNDTLFNLPHGKGFGGLMLRALGSSGGPKVTRLMRMFVLKDKKALAADLGALADTPSLIRWIPAHGAPVDQGAAQVLREVAATL